MITITIPDQLEPAAAQRLMGRLRLMAMKLSTALDRSRCDGCQKRFQAGEKITIRKGHQGPEAFVVCPDCQELMEKAS